MVFQQTYLHRGLLLYVLTKVDTKSYLPINNDTHILPKSVPALYRSNSHFDLLQNYSSLYMLFPLPTNLSLSLPNPSIHLKYTLSCPPISSIQQKYTHHYDTSIVPYATVSEALSDEGLAAVGRWWTLNVGTQVNLTMPRSWTVMLMNGKECGSGRHLS